MGPQSLPEVAPEVLVVGQGEVCDGLIARVRAQGYAAEPCEATDVVDRLGADRMPGAVVLCTDGLQVADVMRSIRDTPLGGAVVVTLYGKLGGSVGGLADVLDLGADHFLEAPASDEQLLTALEELAGPADPPTPPSGDEPGGAFGSWPNRTEVLDGPATTEPPLDVSDPAFAISPTLRGLEERAAESGQAEVEDADVAPPASSRSLELSAQPMPEPAHVLGQLHRTLDMLEQRLRDGPRSPARADVEDDLSKYGLDGVPEVDGDPNVAAQRRDAQRLGVEEFELPLAGLTSPGDPNRREPAGPESTVRLEETGSAELSEEESQHTRASRRREPLEPELESERLRDRPRRARPLPVECQGSIDTTETPRLLWTLHRARFTGRLTLQRGKIEKSVWLEAGNFVFARSNVGHDRLADGLLRRGVLTRSQYESARDLAAKEPRRVGQLLVEAGFLKPGELHRVLRIHLARIIDSTFPWRSGRWLLVPDEACDEPVQLEEAPAMVLAEGVRNRMEPAQLVDLLGGPDMVPRFDPANHTIVGVAELAELLRMTPAEEAWIEKLDGRKSLSELDAGADELELLGLVYLLHVMGYVELSREPEPEPRSDLRPEELDEQRIVERLKMSRQVDYFEILGLDRDACRVDVHRAFSDVSATFADDNLEAAVRRRMAAELAELRGALAEARDVLMDDGLRSAYLAHLEEP